MGLKKKHSCLSLRQSYDTHLLNTGVDIIELQNILGHVSLLTTVRYTHLTIANHDNAYKKINSVIDTVDINWGGAK
jgi:integrase/recombinase XerD